MFPIHDGRGRVIGFGGRVLDSGEPKYLNSPETPVFSKGRELYGLFQARAARSATPSASSSSKATWTSSRSRSTASSYAVATLGTVDHARARAEAVPPDRHRRVLLRRRRRGPQGRVARARERAAGARRRQERAVPVPARRRGSRRLRAQARPGGVRAGARAARCRCPNSCSRELAAQHPPTSAEGRAALVAAARPYLAQIEAPVLAALLARRLAELSGLPEARARAARCRRRAPRAATRADRRRRRPPRPGVRPRAARRPPVADRRSRVQLMQMVLLQPDRRAASDCPGRTSGTAGSGGACGRWSSIARKPRAGRRRRGSCRRSPTRRTTRCCRRGAGVGRGPGADARAGRGAAARRGRALVGAGEQRGAGADVPPTSSAERRADARPAEEAPSGLRQLELVAARSRQAGSRRPATPRDRAATAHARAERPERAEIVVEFAVFPRRPRIGWTRRSIRACAGPG